MPTTTPPILIHQDPTSRWTLVHEAPGWVVERVDGAGCERFSLEVFEASEDGRRLANPLTVALARTPGA